MTSQTINLNLIPGGVAPVINVSQYDKGQTWTFNIYSGSQSFSVPSGANVSVRGTKPDNNGFAYDCTYSGNVVTATEQQQMTAVAGKVAAEIVITKNTEMIGSANFVINVEKAALDSDTPISETEIPAIIELAESQAEDAEAWAKGTKNGQAVPSTAEQYHNNAKYWAEQASGSAADALKSEGYAVGKQNGTDVASDSPYYHNNSKYYSEQAASSASTASTKASQASTSATNAANSATSASGSATTASTKAGEAATSATNAAASAQAAQQAAASFVVDSELSPSSTNPVQNKVITTDLNNVKQALNDEVVTRATLGAHNLLKLDLSEIKSLNTTGTWSNNAYTLNDVTFTFNSDGTISTSGTASDTTTFYLHSYSTWTKLPLKFLSGCPSGGGMDKYILRLVRSGTFSKNDTGEGVLLDQNDIASSVDVTIVVLADNDVSGLTFKPMIRLATDTDPTYQPYAMTNKQLTDARFLNGTLGLAVTQNFTEAEEYTIPVDGWYFLQLQTNVANATGALIIRLGSDNSGNEIAVHRNSGIQYENCSVVIPLKVGTKVVYKCTDTTIQCQYRATPIT